MTETLLSPPLAMDDQPWTLPAGSVACVSGTDDVHDVLDCMREHGLRHVLVTHAGDRYVTVLRREQLAAYDADPCPHRLREVEGGARVVYAELGEVLG